MDDEFDIASWVKQARSHWGQSQEALGDLLGKTKGNISAWEKGRHEPSFKQVIQISEITGYPLPDNIKIKTPGDENRPSGMVPPDDLIDLIRGYHLANAAERDAILRIIRSALKRG
jgi:transcriptional regulator with XRE-family HTH domain